MASDERCTFRYSTTDLLRLRTVCFGISRALRRFLFIRGLLAPCERQHMERALPIPVRISQRTSSSQRTCENQAMLNTSRRKSLVAINREPQRKKPQSIPSPRLPSLMLTNIRSISNKTDELALKMRELKPDFVVLTETWLDDSTPDEALAIPQYDIIRKDRDSHGGGILLYVPEGLSRRMITDEEVSSRLSCQSEILSVLFSNLLLISVYHPFWNDSAMHEAVIQCITDTIDFTFLSLNVNRNDFHIIVCGDFNGMRSCYDDFKRLTGLNSIVHNPTRGRNILDQIFTDIDSNVNPTIVAPIGRSDHSVVSWNPSSSPDIKINKIRVRKFTKANRARFDEIMNTTHWEALVKSEPDLDCAAQYFLDTLLAILNFCFPLRTVRLRSTDPPWFKPSLKILIDDRDRAFANGQTSKYKRLREEVLSHTRYLKSQFLRSTSTTKDAKDTWKSIRNVAKFSKCKSSTQNFSPQQLNDEFSSNFQLDEPLCLEFDISNDLYFELSVFETNTYLKRLRRKSCGPDGIPYWVFREWSTSLSPAVTYLFKRSIETFNVPSTFKKADITPIPKVSRPSQPSEFRPISLLPLLSKVLERIVLDKLIMPLIKDKCDSSQFAYLPGRGLGTTSALTLLNHTILQYLDTHSGAVRVLTVDFSKAFDKITHKSIISACHQFQFPPQLIHWIGSFLSNRVQRVRIGRSFSDWSSVSSGVPQGSVLGPILFCLATNDLGATQPNTRVFKYADDITYLHFIRNSSEDRLLDEWKHCLEWSSIHKLPINTDKCRTMDIITNKSIVLGPIQTESGVLPQVQSIKLLGLTMSSDLKWNLHIDNIITKACKRIYIVRNLCRASCEQPLVYKVYIALIRSLFLFACPSFCNLPNYLLCKLLRVEKRIHRMIPGFNLPQSLPDAIDNTCNTLFDSIQTHNDHPLRSMFEERHIKVNTRNNSSLRRPRARTKRFSLSFIKYCK